MVFVVLTGAAIGLVAPKLVDGLTQTTAAVLILGGIGVALFGVGLYAGVSGLRNYRHGQRLAGATPLNDGASSGDVVSIQGTVVEPADGNSLESNYEGTPCVAYACEVLEKQSADRGNIYESAGGVIRDRSRTNENAIPFVVDVDGQPVRVEADDANLVWSGHDFDSVSAGSVAQNVGKLRGLWVMLSTLARDTHKRRTYYEANLQPGDRVSVTGTVRRQNDVIIEQGPGVPLVVSSNAELSIPGRYRKRGISGFIGAAVFGGVGAALLYALASTL